MKASFGDARTRTTVGACSSAPRRKAVAHISARSSSGCTSLRRRSNALTPEQLSAMRSLAAALERLTAVLDGPSAH